MAHVGDGSRWDRPGPDGARWQVPPVGHWQVPPAGPPGSAEPGPDGWAGWVRARLFEQRIVVVRGELTDELAGQAAAELMTLDASGDEPVALHLDCAGGTLEAAFTLMDTIDLLGVPVHVTCLGRVEGPAVGVVAVAPRRTTAPHTRFRLAVPEVTVQGRARDLEQWADHYRDRLDRFVSRLAAASRRPAEHVEADVLAGRWLTAEEAVRYGLVDEVVRPGATVRPLPSAPARFGFRPPGRP